jgi:(p)ppGpp synthase/HD superfamily hydrolase
VAARRKREGKPYAEPLRVTWVELRVEYYVVPLILSGQDHPGLMHEVSDCATMQGLNVVHSLASSNAARYKARIAITLQIPAKVRLEYVVGRLRRIKGVVSVARDETRGCGKSQQSRP